MVVKITPTEERINLALRTLEAGIIALSKIQKALQEQNNPLWGDVSLVAQQVDDVSDMLENGY